MSDRQNIRAPRGAQLSCKGWQQGAALCFIISGMLFCLACDPGYDMKPIGWADELSGHLWSKNFGDFILETRGIGGLIGESWADPEFEIRGNSKPVTVEAAELRTKSGTYPAKLRNANKIFPVNCRRDCQLGIEWVFDHGHAASDILGDRCVIILKMKVGSENREIEVEFQSY